MARGRRSTFWMSRGAAVSPCSWGIIRCCHSPWSRTIGNEATKPFGWVDRTTEKEMTMKKIFVIAAITSIVFLSFECFAQGVAATTNTVQTTGPVTADTTISVGTLAGQVLTWAAAAFSVPIGSLLTVWLVRLF